jgi:hypothetical protein
MQNVSFHPYFSAFFPMSGYHECWAAAFTFTFCGAANFVAFSFSFPQNKKVKSSEKRAL